MSTPRAGMPEDCAGVLEKSLFVSQMALERCKNHVAHLQALFYVTSAGNIEIRENDMLNDHLQHLVEQISVELQLGALALGDALTETESAGLPSEK